MAAAERLYRQGPSYGRPRWRYLQNVIHQLHHGQEPLLWRGISGADTERAHRYVDRFDDPNLPGAMQVTIDIREIFCGTDLHITQEGIPDVIPPEACYMGWQESLVLLAKLVEAEIPD